MLLVVGTILSIGVTRAQIIGNYLDINNVNAKINPEGSLFNNYGGPDYSSQFEVPKGSGHHSIFAGGLWIGGVDAGFNIKIAGQTYRQRGTDFWPGPLTSSGTTDSMTISTYNRVWKINQCDIDNYHNWATGQLDPAGENPVSESVMEVINSWPVTNAEGGPLAPFHDWNSNGIYEPEFGEVPDIKGDQAIFFVYNDKGGVHAETGGGSMGIEIQGMAYAYSCSDDSALYNTIFTSYKVINKSSFPLDSVFMGNWTDFDIGTPIDDYIGCDVTRGAYYGYNADDFDENYSGILGYGENPPAQAVVFLKGPFANPNGVDDILTPNGTNYGDGITDNERLGMSKFICYSNTFSTMGNPISASDYYRYMNCYWKDSTALTYGESGHTSGGVVCDYMFPGNSDPLGFGTHMTPQPAWNEDPEFNLTADGRALGSFGPFTLLPGLAQTVDFAYVFAHATSGGSVGSINLLKERIDSVRHKFNNRITGCGCASVTGIDDLKIKNSFSIYPNPSAENLTIDYTSASKSYLINIYDATGRFIKTIAAKNGTSFSVADLKAGFVFIELTRWHYIFNKTFCKTIIIQG